MTPELILVKNINLSPIALVRKYSQNKNISFHLPLLPCYLILQDSIVPFKFESNLIIIKSRLLFDGICDFSSTEMRVAYKIMPYPQGMMINCDLTQN